MRVLLVIDVLNDFLPGGSLATTPPPKYIEKLNHEMQNLKYDKVVLVQEMHPVDHISFASTWGQKPFSMSEKSDVLWPDHCVKGTTGCEFPKGLQTDLADIIVRKGTSINIDSYSAFYDNNRSKSTGLELLLKDAHVTLVGIATDYCVKASAIDALEVCDIVEVNLDLCAEVTPETGVEAIKEMEKRGVAILSTEREIF